MDRAEDGCGSRTDDLCFSIERHAGLDDGEG